MPKSERDIRASLFFATGQDLYFLTYNVAVLLDTLGAVGKAPIKDANSLPLLVTLLANEQLVSVLERRTGRVPRSSEDYRLLIRAESAARRKRPFVARLLHALRRRGLVDMVRSNRGKNSVSLTAGTALAELVADPIFGQERKTGTRLRKAVPYLKLMNHAKLYERVFTDRGLPPWPS